jgi:hypothetical protein
METGWEKVKEAHVIKAIEEYNGLSIKDRGPEAKSTFLMFQGNSYPAKHIRGMAYKLANGREISKEDYYGGNETAVFLRGLGFDVRHDTNAPRLEPVPKRSTRLSTTGQKNALSHLLQTQCGIVITERQFPWLRVPEASALPERFRGIAKVLRAYRGKSSFIRSGYPLSCDFVIESRKIIIEYDERQHFSQARLLSLRNYPDGVQLGYSKEDWSRQCERVQARDNDPIDRDEIRAFNDSVRDIEAPLHGYRLIRIKHGDVDWESKEAGQVLSDLLSGSVGEHLIGRLVVSNYDYDLRRWKSAMKSFISKASGNKFTFVVTPGAFMRFEWPSRLDGMTRDEAAKPENLKVLFGVAARRVETAFDSLDAEVKRKWAATADYLSVGIDSYQESPGADAQLVALFDLGRRKVVMVTGKFYPALGEASTLVRIEDTASRLVEIGGERLLLLGCHDLNAYNPRGRHSPKRKKLAGTTRRAIVAFGPTLVLQHPHTTDSPNIWHTPWLTLEKELPSMRTYASGINYKNKDGGRPRRKLPLVLERTKMGDVVDMVV